jgi:hypothetical protein
MEFTLRILPAGDNRKIFDPSALVAGPGNSKGKKGAGVFLQWQIGCGHDFTAGEATWDKI